MNQVPESKEKSTRQSLTDAPGEHADVGALLRAARERKKRSIEKLADQLNLKVEYLEAMENGNFDKLPGTTYTTGFLRTYANALGLNGEDIIGLYKERNPEPDPVQTMHFISPLQQSGIPKGAVIFVSLMLAIFGYGIWYFTNSGEEVPQQVAAVPKHLKAKTGDTDTEAGSESAAKETKTAVAEISVKAKATPGPKAKSKAKSAVAAKTEQKPPADQPEANRSAQQTSVDPQRPEQTDQSAQAAAAPPQAPEAAAGQPAAPVRDGNRVNVPEGSRVVLRATDESWIRVWDSSTQQVLFSGLLKAGQSYYAPDRKGLTMETGNAGGLEIVVDGKPLPPLGEDGVVKRNVALDAEGLKSQAAALNE